MEKSSSTYFFGSLEKILKKKMVKIGIFTRNGFTLLKLVKNIFKLFIITI